jgi:hypothetical protein
MNSIRRSFWDAPDGQDIHGSIVFMEIRNNRER